jgi:large subunit ribosomal protein L25
MAQLTLKAQLRKKLGHQLKSVRSAGNMPGVTYGHGMKPQSVELNLREFEKVFTKAGSSTIVELQLDTEKRNVVIHDVQFHPVTGRAMHVDLYQVRMDEKIKAEVPLKFIGTSPAVKNLGGILVKAMDKLEIEALPNDLPHEIVVDLSVLKNFDDNIALKDLNIPSGVQVLVEDKELGIASVTRPRSEEELKALDEAVTEDVEAIEGVKKEVEGEDVTEKEEGAAEKEPAASKTSAEPQAAKGAKPEGKK